MPSPLERLLAFEAEFYRRCRTARLEPAEVNDARVSWALAMDYVPLIGAVAGSTEGELVEACERLAVWFVEGDLAEARRSVRGWLVGEGVVRAGVSGEAGR